MTTTSERHGDQLIASRYLAARPADVWTAFTTPEGVAAFWGGSHADVPAGSVVIDLRPGGEFSLDTHGTDGRTRRLAFVYITTAEPSELVFDEAVTGLRTTVTIRAEGHGTVLIIRQRRLPLELQTEQAREGLASILDALAAHLERRNHEERRAP